jgi:hypothetical protein
LLGPNVQANRGKKPTKPSEYLLDSHTEASQAFPGGAIEEADEAMSRLARLSHYIYGSSMTSSKLSENPTARPEVVSKHLMKIDARETTQKVVEKMNRSKQSQDVRL